MRRPQPRRGTRSVRRPTVARFRQGRGQGTASMMEFRLVDVGDPHWTREVKTRWGARVNLRVCRSIGRGQKRLLQVAEVSAEPEMIPGIQRYLSTDPRFLEVSVIRLSPWKLFVREVEPAPALCSLLHRTGAFCANCRFLSLPRGGAAEWVVVVPGSSEARPILQELRRATDGRPGARWQVRRFRPSGGLTARQSDALEVALRLGYYRFPRRGRLGDVGRALQVGRSTAAELLRRAEAKVVTQALTG